MKFSKLTTAIFLISSTYAFAGGSTNGDKAIGGTIGIISVGHETGGFSGGDSSGDPKGGGIGRLAGAGTGPGGTASGLRGGAAGSRAANDKLGGADGSYPMGGGGTGN